MIGFEREEDEIIRYYQKIERGDTYGIWGTMLLLRVSFDKAKPFLKTDSGWDEESWTRSMLKKDHEFVLGEMEDFFQFATERAVAHQGVSAVKSIIHYLVWSWLMGDMEMFAYLMKDKNYANFGCPMLLAVAKKYDMLDLLPMNVVDFDVFTRMARGVFCSQMCPGGCGRGHPDPFGPEVILVPPKSKKAAKNGLILPN